MYPSEVVWAEILQRMRGGAGTCLQIGAHDGKSHDPIHSLLSEGEWTGIIVEPVPRFFERLVANYNNSERLIFLNRAIVPTEEQASLPFYTVKPLENPPVYWYEGLSSFDKSVILKHKHSIPDIESLIMQIDVQASTIDHILSEFSIANIDVLIVDTEGLDGMIVRNFPFKRTMPRVVLYEHKHLAPNDAQAAFIHLTQLGYGVLRLGDNNCALMPDVMRHEEVRLLGKLVTA